MQSNTQQSNDGNCSSALYADRPYSCRVCNCDAVFTAEQQKYDVEIKKACPYQFRVLCTGCFAEKHVLLAQNQLLIRRWADEKNTFKNDFPALQQWIVLLKLLEKYGVPPDTSRWAMLRKLLRKAVVAADPPIK
jgi:hypothetical protein